MKKTFNINLGGIVFHIDEDAYELLDQYLSNLRIHFSKEEGAEEIVHDMELRISELFSERLEEIAWRKGWISDDDMLRLAEPMKGNSYGEYMIKLVKR